MIVDMNYIKSLPEPFQVENQDQELEYLTVKGNVNIFCPHCGYILYDGIEHKRGLCEECYGHWKKQ